MYLMLNLITQQTFIDLLHAKTGEGTSKLLEIILPLEKI